MNWYLRRRLSKLEYQNQRTLQKQKDRAEIANQLVRGGMLMNGGGILALLAFIQASVDSESGELKELATWAAFAILMFVIGLGLVTWTNRTRIKVSLEDGKGLPGAKGRQDWSNMLLCIPTWSFTIGCLIFAYPLTWPSVKAFFSFISALS